MTSNPPREYRMMESCKNTVRIIDIHAHILPELDDGARSIDEAVSLIAQSASQGIAGIIATPHYSRRSRNLPGEIIEKKTEEIKKAIKKEYPDFCIYSGNETMWHEELPERMIQGYGLTLAGSKYLLTEFEEEISRQDVFRAVRELQNYGFNPVIAHVERYTDLRKDNSIKALFRMGVGLQMNFDSLAGSFLNKETIFCRSMVKKGYIHFLATDMHRTDFRPPETKGAMKWLQHSFSNETIEIMTYINPMHVINGEAIETI